MPVRSGLVLSVVLVVGIAAHAQMPAFDTISTAAGDIVITPIGHASVGIRHGDDVILVDPARFGPGLPLPPAPSAEEVAQFKSAPPPVPPDREPHPATLVSAFFVRSGQLVRFAAVPAPTLILVTDIHSDHLDPRVIAALRTPTTRVIVPTAAGSRMLDVEGVELMANGETRIVGGVSIEAVPMYNLAPDRESGMTLPRASGVLPRRPGTAGESPTGESPLADVLAESVLPRNRGLRTRWNVPEATRGRHRCGCHVAPSRR